MRRSTGGKPPFLMQISSPPSCLLRLNSGGYPPGGYPGARRGPYQLSPDQPIRSG
ncbi:MAG: hypothetical protein P8N76_28425 [Pirellulaceae bacterium]|nr:hypothetical protein [Pirellulaceae bacterium]